jgi:hypothetical protein
LSQKERKFTLFLLNDVRAVSEIAGSSSASSQELNDSAPVAFGRPALRKRFKFARRFPLGGSLRACLAAGFGFLIKSLSGGCWAAYIADSNHFDFKLTTIIGDPQHIARANVAGRLDYLPVAEYPAKVAGPFRQHPCFEKAGCPQPQVDPYARAFCHG